jgi:hypothetical protein
MLLESAEIGRGLKFQQTSTQRRSKWQQKCGRENINKDPGGEDEKEHG